jgi:hypothetical protein
LAGQAVNHFGKEKIAMTNSIAIVFFVAAATLAGSTGLAQDFGKGPRRDLLETETSELPQGRVKIAGGERSMPPGARSPWHHASGPKFLYVLEGTMTVEGLGGKTLANCGPAPKLCLSLDKDLFYFRNAREGPLKFLVIGIDAAEKPTNHEEVGQVTGISGNRVTFAVGDLRSSDLAVPRREITVAVSAPTSVAVGDYVVTIGHNEKTHTVESFAKLMERWR